MSQLISQFMRTLYCLISLCLFSVLGHGEPQVVKIGMGNFEPYFIAKGQTGIFTDILTAVFKQLPQYQPNFLFERSNNRLILEFKQGNIDAVSNLFDENPLDVCRSEPVFRFKDMAISLNENDFHINQAKDLQGKSIITFQGAKEFFTHNIKQYFNEDHYREVGKPAWQVRVLLDKGAQVSIGDVFIFLHSAQLIQGVSFEQFRFHNILPITYSRMGFRDKILCGAFNTALAKVKASGEYDAIYNEYLKRYQMDDVINLLHN